MAANKLKLSYKSETAVNILHFNRHHHPIISTLFFTHIENKEGIDKFGQKRQKTTKQEIMNEPMKKRPKPTSKEEGGGGEEEQEEVHLPDADHDEEVEQIKNLDKQIEEEENAADNIVIKDLMGSVRPEPNRVKFFHSKLIFMQSIAFRKSATKNVGNCTIMFILNY